MTAASTSLDFSIVNHLALAIDRGRIDANAPPPFSARKLGPVVESISVTRLKTGTRFATLDWLELGEFQDLVDDVRTGKTRAQRTGQLTGWIAADEIENDVSWTGFLIRVSAAVKAGNFDDHSKNAIMATFGEFRSNVIEHAGELVGSFAAFHLSGDCLEMVVSDFGRGVLDSLKDNPVHSGLDDHGRALTLAVSQGVSRYQDPSRGNGFSNLFEGLANRFNHIRLRSGDHALEVTRGAVGTPDQKTSQVAPISGLMIFARFDR